MIFKLLILIILLSYWYSNHLKRKSQQAHFPQLPARAENPPLQIASGSQHPQTPIRCASLRASALFPSRAF
ncbi:hypothetical protein EAE99_000631 [Botrytis elliptica]|nr:hypothetical protein EAE99_000631 [Botrytis elliptica]